MISISCALYHDKLRAYVEQVENPTCKFVGESGMDLVFETSDDDLALVNVKKALKSTPDFKTVYFQIHIK